MVASNELFSPQAYLEEVTGKCYIMDKTDDRATILKILQENNKDKSIYGLDDTDKIITKEGKFVLVECMRYDEIDDKWFQELTWCEI